MTSSTCRDHTERNLRRPGKPADQHARPSREARGVRLRLVVFGWRRALCRYPLLQGMAKSRCRLLHPATGTISGVAVAAYTSGAAVQPDSSLLQRSLAGKRRLASPATDAAPPPRLGRIASGDRREMSARWLLQCCRCACVSGALHRSVATTASKRHRATRCPTATAQASRELLFSSLPTFRLSRFADVALTPIAHPARRPAGDDRYDEGEGALTHAGALSTRLRHLAQSRCISP